MREAKGLSQEKLARLADVANNTIIKIETGVIKKPSVFVVIKITKTLGVDIKELIK